MNPLTPGFACSRSREAYTVEFLVVGHDELCKGMIAAQDDVTAVLAALPYIDDRRREAARSHGHKQYFKQWPL